MNHDYRKIFGYDLRSSGCDEYLDLAAVVIQARDDHGETGLDNSKL